MNPRRSKKIISFLLVIFFIAAFLFLAFNENGLLKLIRLKSDLNKLNEEIELLTKENNALRSEIDSLRNKIPAKIERTAREKHGLIRPGEEVIEIIEK
jgi:cell division protein FtsB